MPQQHHLLELPLDSEQFASSGIVVIDNPLIERIFAFQGAILAFCLTVPRFFEMLELVSRHNMKEADIERMLPRYATELTLVWHHAQTELELLENALAVCGFPQVPMWDGALRGICKKLLFAVDPNESPTLTSDDFFAWSSALESEFQQLNALVENMLSALLVQAPPQPHPA